MIIRLKLRNKRIIIYFVCFKNVSNLLYSESCGKYGLCLTTPQNIFHAFTSEGSSVLKTWFCLNVLRKRKSPETVSLRPATHNSPFSWNFGVISLNYKNIYGAWGSVVLRRCATSRKVLGSIPGGVTVDFFHGSPRRNHVLWVDSAPENEYQGFLLA
jgi:hypothetical protein